MSMKYELEDEFKISKINPNYFNKTQLNKGIKIEMEHTENKKAAEIIAKQHLLENPNYYKQVKSNGIEKLVTTKNKSKKKSIFNTPIKSKRRSEIISIKSPTAFRNSIRELKKGKYTLGDYRALILAQNRAKAMLNRKTLSQKERKQMKDISNSTVPKP